MFKGVIDSGIGALDRIVSYKHDEVIAAQSHVSEYDLATQYHAGPPTRGFAAALSRATEGGANGLICEIKRRSPSAGDILAGADPVQVAAQYAAGGAACLSVLTDGRSFGGHLDDIRAIRAALDIPILRKDFVISSYQIHEARQVQADCVLLIVAILEDALLRDLAHLAFDLGLDVLIEAHTADELDRALALPHTLLGINNRDLRVMTTDLNTTADLVGRIPDGHAAPIVSESGVHSPADITKLRQSGARRFLIGESLMMSDDRGALLNALRLAQ